jgi:hypothetical protein
MLFCSCSVSISLNVIKAFWLPAGAMGLAGSEVRIQDFRAFDARPEDGAAKDRQACRCRHLYNARTNQHDFTGNRTNGSRKDLLKKRVKSASY